jgi:hypothetical protein
MLKSEGILPKLEGPFPGLEGTYLHKEEKLSPRPHFTP